MVPDGVHESLVEIAIVEEGVWIVVPVIEVSLHRLDRFYHSFQFLIASKNDKGSIRARLCCVRYCTASLKDSVMLGTDLSIKEKALVSFVASFIRQSIQPLTVVRVVHHPACISAQGKRDAS